MFFYPPFKSKNSFSSWNLSLSKLARLNLNRQLYGANQIEFKFSYFIWQQNETTWLLAAARFAHFCALAIIIKFHWTLMLRYTKKKSHTDILCVVCTMQSARRLDRSISFHVLCCIYLIWLMDKLLSSSLNGYVIYRLTNFSSDQTR